MRIVARRSALLVAVLSLTAACSSGPAEKQAAPPPSPNIVQGEPQNATGCVTLINGEVCPVGEVAVPTVVPGLVEDPNPVTELGVGIPDYYELDVAAVERLDTGEAAASGRRSCIFNTRGDWVHISENKVDASGHGWWEDPCRSGKTARVTIWLQQYWSDGVWRNAGTRGEADVLAGGGAGKRANGRATCNARSLVSWRSVVDVDILYTPDGDAKLVTPVRNLRCYY